MKKLHLLILLIILIFWGVFIFLKTNEFLTTQENSSGLLKSESLNERAPFDLPAATENSENEKKEEINPLNENLEKENQEDILPKKFKLDVLFTSQAPFAVWDFDHNNGCEEAAILMTHYFLQKKELTPEIADKEILAIIDYQKKNWGGHFDLEAEETAKLAKEFYGYKDIKVKYDILIEDIKKEIADGNPVILPTAGRLLKNPYYRQPGPLYHMIVAIGFDDEKGEMVVNDPGTKRGKDFSYKYEILENALHEWNSGEVKKGKKAMIIVKP